MESQGYVRGKWEASRSGRRRRCHHLVEREKKKLAPTRSEWADLFRALPRLTKVADA